MRLCGVVPPTPEAVYIVRNILRDPNVGPLTTKGIYYRALQVKPETLGLPKTPATKSQPEQGKKSDIIPYPYHPIRSKSYLKDTVLYFLERRREIEKIHVFRKATPKERSRMLQALREKKPSANVSDVPENIDQWMWRPRGLIRRSGSRIGGEEDSNAM
ncbi:hypothetical protein BD410DRAFT_837479 [Rickenella mellea]|uniref:Uncharacterized protein n=1 Tax=Rickenella mellea TaxID=50990 RepID=A0A4Y7QDI3_9AGAM|nr:hypothetical protein BD410DRAFT_837479 [Rickenella mellea]